MKSQILLNGSGALICIKLVKSILYSSISVLVVLSYPLLMLLQESFNWWITILYLVCPVAEGSFVIMTCVHNVSCTCL
jgi:hypothetical protein